MSGRVLVKIGSGIRKNSLKKRKKKYLFNKSRIQETKHLSTDADSSNDTKKILLVRPNLSTKKVARQLYTLYEQKYSNLKQLLSISFSQGLRKSKKFGLLEVGAKRRLNRVKKGKKFSIFFSSILDHF